MFSSKRYTHDIQILKEAVSNINTTILDPEAYNPFVYSIERVKYTVKKVGVKSSRLLTRNNHLIYPLKIS